jgi:hypothetical protein
MLLAILEHLVSRFVCLGVHVGGLMVSGIYIFPLWTNMYLMWHISVFEWNRAIF